MVTGLKHGVQGYLSLLILSCLICRILSCGWSLRRSIHIDESNASLCTNVRFGGIFRLRVLPDATARCLLLFISKYEVLVCYLAFSFFGENEEKILKKKRVIVGVRIECWSVEKRVVNIRVASFSSSKVQSRRKRNLGV